ncbi:CinA family protein [Salinibacterium hongtaonis]|uniref:CinA family protein n=1 Tax=Homoserinimonas hongtaonis TaxID=2079791 RepID=A0A2U1T275_9MICO|nr:CinA family protein [Salinibacterium hongtaonis]AWB88229.1 CinA family protein [Salinibacterium hongtaonis]PWB97967.1 CinA family protein [Salinibacterium hongtaonis]
MTTSSDVELIAAGAAESGVSIAIAESLTSGRLATQVGAGREASEWFAGAVVAYHVSTKQKLFGLPPGVDPCSAECAEILATGVRELLEADVAISTTGVGGPDEQDGHRPGTVYVGWATSAGAGSTLCEFDGNPDEILDQTVAEALRILAAMLS